MGTLYFALAFFALVFGLDGMTARADAFEGKFFYSHPKALEFNLDTCEVKWQVTLEYYNVEDINPYKLGYKIHAENSNEGEMVICDGISETIVVPQGYLVDLFVCTDNEQQEIQNSISRSISFDVVGSLAYVIDTNPELELVGGTVLEIPASIDENMVLHYTVPELQNGSVKGLVKCFKNDYERKIGYVYNISSGEQENYLYSGDTGWNFGETYTGYIFAFGENLVSKPQAVEFTVPNPENKLPIVENLKWSEDGKISFARLTDEEKVYSYGVSLCKPNGNPIAGYQAIAKLLGDSKTVTHDFSNYMTEDGEYTVRVCVVTSLPSEIGCSDWAVSEPFSIKSSSDIVEDDLAQALRDAGITGADSVTEVTAETLADLTQSKSEEEKKTIATVLVLRPFQPDLIQI